MGAAASPISEFLRMMIIMLTIEPVSIGSTYAAARWQRVLQWQR